MKTLSLKTDRASKTELARVIEPLTSYICASERPSEMLYSALSVLLAEVKETNRTARLHISCRRADLLELVA